MQGFFGRNDCGMGCGQDSCWIILLLLLLGNCGCNFGQNIDCCTLILLLIILGGCGNGCQNRTCC